jgi:hypothetical protein
MRLTGRRTFRSALAAAVLAAAGVLAMPSVADAAPVPLNARERGNDVSYPQCGAALPTGSDFGIVGVDGGKPFDPNPCLAEQIVWARTFGHPAYYLNTANPGPRLSSHWPLGQRSPQVCTRSRPDSAGCAFDYGWNSAKDSLRRARAAAASVSAPDVTRTTWWLDVEMHNTWESLEYSEKPMFLRNDTAVLRGMTALLHRRGVRTVGVYSTAHQWQRITGGASLDRAPVWYAGVGAVRSAHQHCARTWSFNGGPVRLSQFLRNGFDADLRC